MKNTNSNRVNQLMSEAVVRVIDSVPQEENKTTVRYVAVVKVLESQEDICRVDDIKSEVHSCCVGMFEEVKKLVGSSVDVAKKASLLLPSILLRGYSVAFASGGADAIREGFQQLLDVATAIAEPILWFYAVTACVLMATGKNKSVGWDRLKNVGYGYILMVMMPTIFEFFRFIASILQTAIKIG